MKLTKYTFRTPLFGSIETEELLPEEDGRLDLYPEQMSELYDQNEKLMLFLTENAEDATPYVPEELKDVVLRAEFGDFAIVGSRMYLRTYIWTEEDVNETVIMKITDWITGQMADGWGEGLEQREWWSRQVERPFVYFDEDALDFEEGSDPCWVSYYVHPWNSQEFDVYLEDAEDVEEELDLSIVATISLPNHNLQVVKLSNSFALRMFLKEFGRLDIMQAVEDYCMMNDSSFYFVRNLEGDNGIEILPKWVSERGCFCTMYEVSADGDIKPTTLPLNKAVLELLK